jgi:hypothetical protein
MEKQIDVRVTFHTIAGVALCQRFTLPAIYSTFSTAPPSKWPAIKDECRLPVNGQVVVTRTRDAGQSFAALSTGLPQKHAYDLIYRHCLDVDSSGDRLAIGSTTGALWVSENQGDSWQCVSRHLPPLYCVRFAD